MNQQTTDQRATIRVTLLGMLMNAILAVVKLLSGLFGHSYALVADAIESMTDILSSLILWGGLYVAQQPPDENHPYGHGKAEALTALIISLMLIGAAIGILGAAVREIVAPKHSPAPFTLLVLVMVIVVKETMYHVARRTALRTGSSAGAADAWHHRSDAITSLAAAVGITIALLGGPGYERADAIAAILAAVVIGFNAVRIMRPPLFELMDADCREVSIHAEKIARQVQGVLGVETVISRKIGNRYLVDMHVEVDPTISVHHGHEIAHLVKDEILNKEPVIRDVLIHIEPHRTIENTSDKANKSQAGTE